MGRGFFWLFFALVVHPLFHPLPGLTHFLWARPKKVSKEMRARDGDFPLNLCRREGGEANSLRSDSLPSFSSLQQKFKAPSRAGKSKTKPTQRQRKRQGQPHDGLAFFF
jgi:hypothetical protein